MRLALPELQWNKAIDSFDFGDFGQWMQDYERSLMPSEAVYPRDGQVWEAGRRRVKSAATTARGEN